MKELRLWEFETEIPKEKWGVKILRQLSGSARAAADSLSFEDLACEAGRDNLIKALKEHFAPHLESSLPRAFEEAIYGDVRSSRETFGEFVIRMEHAFKELERQGVKLGDVVLGYVLFRGANLSEALATYQDVRKSLRDQKNRKGRGKDQRPTLAFKGKNRDYVKFTKNGTKIHVDMLKLRTRCA
ncbi:unnamed protein product, partial [Symbiodinium microadriaticum]